MRPQTLPYLDVPGEWITQPREASSPHRHLGMFVVGATYDSEVLLPRAGTKACRTRKRSRSGSAPQHELHGLGFRGF